MFRSFKRLIARLRGTAPPKLDPLQQSLLGLSVLVNEAIDATEASGPEAAVDLLLKRGPIATQDIPTFDTEADLIRYVEDAERRFEQHVGERPEDDSKR